MSYSSEVLADSPAGYWHLDEASGTNAADSSGNAFDGTYSGSPTLNQSPLINAGASVSFDGSNDKVAVAAHTTFNANNQITVEAWIQTTTTLFFACVVDSDDEASGRYFQFRVRSDNHKLNILLFDSGGSTHSLDSTINVNDGVLRHVVATYDGSTIKLYLNGSLDNSLNTTFTLKTTNTGLWIGTHNNGSAQWYGGTIDEVAIYTTALTSTRITAHYNAGVASGLTDAGTISGTTTPSITDNVDSVDSATINSKTTPSIADVAADVDSGTIVGVTSFSGTDVFEHAGVLDSGTIASQTTFTTVEVLGHDDSATITTTTTPSIPIDLQETTTVTLSGSLQVGDPLTATITVGVPTATGDGGGFIGTGTTVGGDTPSSYTGVSGYWGPTDDDNGIIT